MPTVAFTQTDWSNLVDSLGETFAERASQHDREGSFVQQNYEMLKAYKFFSAMIPIELGGGGMSYSDMCHIIQQMAHYCGSTALAFSMHQHLIAASVWKYLHKGVGKEMLQKVAQEQTVLISTGARDWLESNGSLTKVEGGYLLSGKKAFASQSIAGDIAITSAPFITESGEEQVLHFGVPMNAEGVSVADDWHVLGMRGTGSHSILFDKVFIPLDIIALTRPRGEFHMVWNVVLTVAMPLIMSAYVGIAEKAREIAIHMGKSSHRNHGHIHYLIGKLNNSVLAAHAQWQAMYSLTDNFQFTPSEEVSSQIISYKTNVANASIQAVSEAMEAIGGQSFYQKNQLERLFRDVQAAQFHPLPKWNQYAFVGERLLK